MDLLNIIVTGPAGGGKTAFIASASEIPVVSLTNILPPEDPGHLLEFGRIQINDEVFLYLIGAPFDDRFPNISGRAEKGLAGLVLIVDSAGSSFSEVQTIIKSFKSLSGAPVLIVANRLEDSPAAIKKMREALNLKIDQQLVATDATNKESVKKAILNLLSSAQTVDGKKTA